MKQENLDFFDKLANEDFLKGFGKKINEEMRKKSSNAFFDYLDSLKSDTKVKDDDMNKKA